MSLLPVKVGCVVAAAAMLTLLLLFAQAMAITPDRELDFRADWLNVDLPTELRFDCAHADWMLRQLESDAFRGCTLSDECRIASGATQSTTAIAVDLEEPYFELLGAWRQIIRRHDCPRSIACGGGPFEARCRDGRCRIEHVPREHLTYQMLPQPERLPLTGP